MQTTMDPPATTDQDQHGVQADGPRIRKALEDGGRAVVTVRSRATGKHVTITLTARKRKPDGQGWVSRGTIEGRVGALAADVLEARDPQREYQENYIGRLYLDTGAWKAGKAADGARVWTAERVIAFAFGGSLDHDVFLATECSYCGKKLFDPQSVERGIGPECYGRHTSSRMQKHGEVV